MSGELQDSTHAAPVAPAADAPSTVARIVAVFIPALICLAGIAFAGLMIATRPEAERNDAESRGTPVQVQALAATSESITINVQGQVIPAREITLQPELSGRVVWMNDELVPGGRLNAGDTALRIDPRDYRAALEQRRAQVESGHLSVSQEESRRVIAEREWALLERERGGASTRGRELALREPQARAAQASLRASQSALRSARTNLSRTTLTVPFDAFVQMERVEIGQLVGPSSQLATLVGTEHFWVRAAVPMEQLSWIQLPAGEQPGAHVRVVQHVGESAEIVREGRIIRLLGDLDPVGRMARVLVEVDDPLGEPGELPLLIGASVDIEIEAGTLDGVYRIPRSALHPADQVYLFGEGALDIRDVEVAWREHESLLVRGLTDADELVLSDVVPAIAGTALRRAEEHPGGEAASTEASPEDAADDDTRPETP